MKALLLIPIAVSLFVFSWSILEPVGPNGETTDQEDFQPISSYIVDGAQRQFSVDGTQSHTLVINSAVHWQHKAKTELSEINYSVEGNNGERWNIRASKGLFLDDLGELELSHGVKIEEALRNIEITTDNMLLLTESQRAIGTHTVTLVAKNSRTVGSAFELDLNNSTAKLFGDVKTDYD